MAASSLSRRVATALVLVALVLAALFALPPAGWALAVLVFVLLGALEWSRLCALSPAGRLAFLSVIALAALALLYAPAAGFAHGFPDAVVYVACGAGAAFWLAVAPRWLAAGWPFAGMAGAAAGVIVLLAAWVAIVALHARSPWLVLAAMAIVWIADIAAYFAGRRFGRRKLAPAISPGKTWEGVWGALGAVAVYALVLAAAAPAAMVPAGPAATLALVAFLPLVAAISVVGDLYESLLKRQAGVKDSGALLPGHGGVLDRVDALLAAMPFAALAATAFLPRSGA
ncbi:MAG: phosphatidate cytidylyltransferase [Betaproteobacteria bacterium]|nr:phosphatidate cytidylyltransferase [Betaproteobacteria bacterium]MDH5286906.1 phosphatidate cytidylyltransferase [Betaproteobacteria bacterium]